MKAENEEEKGDVDLYQTKSKENGDNEVDSDKAEEHLSSIDSIVDSKQRGNDLFQLSGLKEIAKSDGNNMEDEDKDTDNNKEKNSV